MSWWRSLFGGGARPEETMRLTRRVMDLFAEGKSDEDAERVLFHEGVPVERARSIVAEVRRVQRRMRGG
jgi:hypothetical protein